MNLKEVGPQNRKNGISKHLTRVYHRQHPQKSWSATCGLCGPDCLLDSMISGLPLDSSFFFGLMLDRISDNEQMIFTTHNTDMLDLNLPKHSFMFLRKKPEDGDYKVTAISASEILKRNTDSIRNAVENDVFESLPDDSLLDKLEMGWGDE